MEARHTHTRHGAERRPSPHRRPDRDRLPLRSPAPTLPHPPKETHSERNFRRKERGGRNSPDSGPETHYTTPEHPTTRIPEQPLAQIALAAPSARRGLRSRLADAGGEEPRHHRLAADGTLLHPCGAHVASAQMAARDRNVRFRPSEADDARRLTADGGLGDLRSASVEVGACQRYWAEGRLIGWW